MMIEPFLALLGQAWPFMLAATALGIALGWHFADAPPGGGDH
jgi:hypothetical protein